MQGLRGPFVGAVTYLADATGLPDMPDGVAVQRIGRGVVITIGESIDLNVKLAFRVERLLSAASLLPDIT